MITRQIWAGGILVLSLAGCQPGGVFAPQTVAQGTACQTEDVQPWVGQDVGLFDPMPGLVVRIVQPGDPVTQDYNPNRVTFVVDEIGIIQSAKCG